MPFLSAIKIHTLLANDAMRESGRKNHEVKPSPYAIQSDSLAHIHQKRSLSTAVKRQSIRHILKYGISQIESRTVWIVE